MRWISLSWLVSALLLLASREGRAEEPPEDPLAKFSPWYSKRHTFYVASASDVGFIYARPHLTVAWGAPFWQFVGVDAYVISTNSFAAAYVGWRASLPWLDVQWGGRTMYPYNRRYLPVQPTYEATDLPLHDGDERSTYRVVELEITPVAPLFDGGVFAEIHPMWIDAPKDRYVYEEVMRAVVKPPFAMRTRLGYVKNLDADGKLKLGGLVEYMVTPGRPKNVTRLGPLFLVSFTKYIEGLASVTLPVSTPDSLGFYEGSYGVLGMRFRWAQRL